MPSEKEVAKRFRQDEEARMADAEARAVPIASPLERANEDGSVSYFATEDIRKDAEKAEAKAKKGK